MIYEYKCKTCKLKFEVVKSPDLHRREEKCEKCGKIGTRVFSTSAAMIDKTQPEFYHAFGKVIKNKRERKEEMRKQNLIEVGNEKPSVMHKETSQVLRKKREKRYSEALR